MSQAAVMTHRYLRPEDLARLRHMQFRPRGAVRGHYAGRHRSRQHGQSVEFNDYRQYMPGDDVGEIDWKVYGRSDRLYLKLFEHQTDMTTHLLVDGSMSMGFRGADAPWHTEATNGPVSSWMKSLPRRFRKPEPNQTGPSSKYELAAYLSAAIGFLVRNQQDRVGLTVARNNTEHTIPPAARPNQLDLMLRMLEELWPQGQADLATTMTRLSTTLRRRSIVMVFSDLFEADARNGDATRANLLKAMGQLRHRGHEVVVFHVLHAHELTLPDLGQAMLVDSENGNRLRLNSVEARKDYQQRMQDFLSRWQKACSSHGIDYQRVSTDKPYADALERYLFQRAGRV